MQKENLQTPVPPWRHAINPCLSAWLTFSNPPTIGAPSIARQEVNSARTPKLDGERTRPGCSFPRPRGKPGAREIVQDASEQREAQRAGREARPATPEGGCARAPEKARG